MQRDVTAILLAGSIRPSPLAEAVGRPVLGLPLADGRSLAATWVARLAALGCVRRLVVTANDHEVAARLEPLFARDRPVVEGTGLEIEILRETASHRGAGGVVRDIAGDVADDRPVLVIESSRVPPDDLAPLLAAGFAGGAGGAVGRDADGRASGVLLLAPDAIRQIPEVGYFDLKEQLLPRLHGSGLPLRAADLSGGGRAIRTLRTYLAALRRGGARGIVAHEGARFDGAPPAVHGFAVVGPRVRIAADVVLRDAVILEGAEIEPGAVVNGTVVGGDARVAPETRLDDAIVASDGATARAVPSREPAGVRRLGGRRPLVPGRAGSPVQSDRAPERAPERTRRRRTGS